MNWTKEQISDCIQLYETMVALQSKKRLGPAKSKGQTSKAALVRSFIADHPDRSRPSVEMMLMNISAERKKRSITPLVDGYKPLPNGSKLIGQILDEQTK